MTTIHTVGVVRLCNATTGSRTGTIDVCRDESGSVYLRVNRLGEEVVIRMRPEHAMTVAGFLNKAASVEP